MSDMRRLQVIAERFIRHSRTVVRNSVDHAVFFFNARLVYRLTKHRKEKSFLTEQCIRVTAETETVKPVPWRPASLRSPRNKAS